MKFLFNSVTMLTLFTYLSLNLMANNINTNAITQASENKPVAKSWKNFKPIHTLKLKEIYSTTNCPIYSRLMAISPDSKTIAIASYSYERSCGGPADGNSSLSLWDLQTGKLVKTLFKGNVAEAFNYKDQFEPLEGSSNISGDIVNGIAWSPDGKTIAAALGNKTVKVWTNNGQELLNFKGHKYAVHTVAFSSDGKTLASGSSDKTIKLWNIQTGKLKTTLQGHENIVKMVKISPDNQTLISQTGLKNIKLWNLKTNKLIATINPGKSPDNLLPIAYSPDGKIVGTTDYKNTVKLFNSSTGKLLKTLTGHKNKVMTLVFDLSSKTIITTSDDRTVKIWNISTGKVKRTLTNQELSNFKPSSFGANEFSLNADNKTFATNFILTAKDGNYPLGIVRLWDLETGKVIRDFPAMFPFAFTPNGNTFIGGSAEGFKVWQ